MPKYTRRSAQQWKTLVDEQKTSGLTATAYCQQQGLGYASFCQWRKRLDSASAEAVESLPAFIAVEPAPEPSSDPHWVVQLQLGSGAVLRIGKL